MITQEPFRFLFLIAFLNLVCFAIEIGSILAIEERDYKFVTLSNQRVRNKMVCQCVVKCLSNLFLFHQIMDVKLLA